MTVFRHTLLALVMGVLFLGLTPTASAASFFGPIVPEACQACPCGFGGVLDAMRNVMNLGIAIAVAVATIIIAWGGFLYIMSPANPESRSTANKMLINAAIGLLIVLSAWLIVDFVMKTLYSGPDGEAGKFGPWNTILTGGDICVQSKATSPLFKGSILAVPGVDTGGSGSYSGGTTDEAKRINAFMQAAASAGLEAVYEVGAESRRQALVAAGVGGSVLALGSHISGEHFSVYSSGGCGGTASQALKDNPSCPTCAPISGPSCKNSCKVAASFSLALRSIPTNNSTIGSWTVTEAFPPSSKNHTCSCHYTGTCIDAAFR